MSYPTSLFCLRSWCPERESESPSVTEQVHGNASTGTQVLVTSKMGTALWQRRIFEF